MRVISAKSGNRKLFMGGFAALLVVFGLLLALSSQSVAATYIGEAKAKTIALAHAKVSPASVRKFDIEFDSDKGRATYEIEFTTDGNVEYEYEIDAVTGEILKWKTDRD